jgi:hypothetical protein
MVISDENTKPVIIDNLYSPIVSDFFWILDLEQKDFALTRLTTIEEHTTPMLVISVFGYAIELPADWNILICSPETSQLDISEIHELSQGSFHSLVLNHATNKIHHAPVKVVHYEPKSILYTPSLAKNQMLCHALGPQAWICISPIDNYGKYLKGSITNDLIY